jgi:hypothetical protein
MTQNQIAGLVLLGIAILDTATGLLLVAPRVADESKRKLLRVVFSASGVFLGGLGFALYKGLVQLF